MANQHQNYSLISTNYEEAFTAERSGKSDVNLTCKESFCHGVQPQALKLQSLALRLISSHPLGHLPSLESQYLSATQPTIVASMIRYQFERERDEQEH